ncbi:MAG: protein kinase, partial [Bacteroidetes bacterium]|nr:protein kinase [Bacteroidota bacterium]
AYMSPEQARGEEVDLRTDIWSVGVVLYETVTGNQPFPGSYEQAVVYSILNQDPEPLTAVRTGVPMQLEWMVSKCLAKKAENRYQTVTDLLVDLRNVNLTTSGISRMSGIQSAHAPAATASGEGKPSFAAAAKKVWPLIAIAVVVTLA